MSFPAYPSYRDSGIDWLSCIPNHWQSTTIKRAIRFQTGWTPPTGRDDLYGGGNTWVTIGDLNGRTVSGSSKQVTDEAIELVGISPSPKGSLLFSFKLSIGQVAFAGRDLFTNEAIATFLPCAEVNLTFAYYAFPIFVVQNAAENIYGAKLLNQELIREAKLVLPPLSEQATIAAFLDRETAKIDMLVDQQRRLIGLLKEKRQAVISHAVTKGADPTVPMKDTGVEWLGNVPAHWTIAPLRHVAKVQTGVAKGKDLEGRVSRTVPYLRVANVQDGYIDLSDVAEIDIAADDVGRYLLKKGDVLMNEGGDFDKLGRGHIWQAQIDPCIHQNHVFAVRPTGLTPEWLNLATSSSYAQFYFMSRSKQSTNLASISSRNVMNLPVLLPPASEQQSLVEHVRAAQLQLAELRAAAENAVQLLSEHRAALIFAAVTGKIDVRGAVPQQAEAA